MPEATDEAKLRKMIYDAIELAADCRHESHWEPPTREGMEAEMQPEVDRIVAYVMHGHAPDRPADPTLDDLRRQYLYVDPLGHGLYKVLLPLVHGGCRISRCTADAFIPDQWCYGLPAEDLYDSWAAWDGNGCPDRRWTRRMTEGGINVYPNGRATAGSTELHLPAGADPALFLIGQIRTTFGPLGNLQKVIPAGHDPGSCEDPECTDADCVAAIVRLQMTKPPSPGTTFFR